MPSAIRRFAFAAACVLAAGLSGAQAQDRAVPQSQAQVQLSFAPIVRSTSDLGHSLGLKVVAEGVEDKPTWDLLGEFGCDAAQGYYMARPMPAADLSAWLLEH